MTDRISEIKEHQAKATPGEWIVTGRGNTVPSLAVVVNGTEENIASCIRPKTGNADFIAHAPADIDYLLSELANRDEEIERLREAQKPKSCERCRYWYSDDKQYGGCGELYNFFHGDDIATSFETHKSDYCSMFDPIPAPPANGGGKE